MTKLTAKDLNDLARYAMPEELEYLASLARAWWDWRGGLQFVMIGAGPGVMVLALLEKLMPTKDYGPHLWVIDNDPDRFYYMMKHVEAAEISQEHVHCIEGDSAETGRNWQTPIDLLIVDGDHSYEGVKRDIEAWLPLVTSGGYIFFHDYLERPGGFNGIDEWKTGPVARAVGEIDESLVEFVTFVGISVVYRKV